MCLDPSKCTAPITERIALHLSDALKLLNYSMQECRTEFEREFLSYWIQKSTSNHIRVYSLVTPGKKERELFYYHDSKHNAFIIGDDSDNLINWLKNKRIIKSNLFLERTWLSRVSRTWIPDEYPECFDDLLEFVALEKICKPLKQGKFVPILFETETESGQVFVAVIVGGINRKKLIHGFRNIHCVTDDRIRQFCRNTDIHRVNVSRVDGAWIHGRGHTSNYDRINGCCVAIIGCGAIGSSLARLLAQAGVGEIMFIDHDILTSANISRHLLGLDCVDNNKALLLQRELGSQFPHLKFDHAYNDSFEKLTKEKLGILTSVDLIITCGLDYESESAVDKWRLSQSSPPTCLSTWVEAYATAGHALLLQNNESILSAFDDEEEIIFRLTNWPKESHAVIQEAGCGNTFQPHGVVDLHPTIGMAAKLALDFLLGKVPESCRRVWMGDPSLVLDHGGIVIEECFTDSMAIHNFSWRYDV